MLSNEIREKIIDSYLKGHCKKEISSIFSIKLPTVYAVIKVFLEEGRIESKLKGGPRKKSLNAEQQQYIQSSIDEDAGITLKKLQENLIEKFDVTVCEKTIANCIKNFNYSFKRISLLPIRRNDDLAIERRVLYARSFLDILSQFDESKIIYVDEIGFNIALRTKMGRSLRGTRAVHVVAGLRSRNISVCCAMTKNGVKNFQVQNNAFNTGTFLNFLDTLLQSIANDGPHVIIVDNVPLHTSSLVKNKIDNSNNVLLLLPPYSPFLNPIENLFSKWKQNIRQSRPRNEKELLGRINNIYNIITSNDCASYYRHMFGFITRCLNREIIIDE